MPTENAAAEVLLEVRDLHISFGRHAVLRGLNLIVPRGQTLAVIGESGCGKSVLLKTMIELADQADS